MGIYSAEHTCISQANLGHTEKPLSYQLRNADPLMNDYCNVYISLCTANRYW